VFQLHFRQIIVALDKRPLWTNTQHATAFVCLESMQQACGAVITTTAVFYSRCSDVQRLIDDWLRTLQFHGNDDSIRRNVCFDACEAVGRDALDGPRNQENTLKQTSETYCARAIF